MDRLMTRRSVVHRPPARGFSLVELVVVIGIIVLVISIVLPALSGARNAAKVAATTSQISELSDAISLFKQDQNRLPGYFSARELGSTENETTGGFTPMQNAMLELVGGIVKDQTSTGTDIATVGPTSTRTVKVRLDAKTGLPSENLARYLPAKGNFFKKQDGVSGGRRSGSAENGKLAEYIDSFGQPVLLWAADPTAAGVIESLSGNNDNALVRENSPAASSTTPPARFYWASNAAFLKNDPNLFVGDQRKLQVGNSFIAEDDAEHVKNLSVLLGSPTAPGNITSTYDQMVPAAVRGSYVVQSSGKNFTYMGLRERLAGSAVSGKLLFGSNFKDSGGNLLKDSSGKPTSTDIIAQSDDIIQSGN